LTGELLSGGNFHGEYPAKVLDFLTIAIHEAGNVSEVRLNFTRFNFLGYYKEFGSQKSDQCVHYSDVLRD
jgi:hypothetical protein